MHVQPGQPGQPEPFTLFPSARQERSSPLPAAFPKHGGMLFPVMKGFPGRGRTVFDLDGDANTPYVAPARKIPGTMGRFCPMAFGCLRRVSI